MSDVYIIGDKTFDLTRKSLVMGILNATPDSFSDGGKYNSLDAAIARAEEMAAQGADIIDVGGESTRPGAKRITPEEEIDRVVPIIKQIAARLPKIIISIDTVKSAVALAAVKEGAQIINDVSAFTYDDRMAEATAANGASAILMHASAEPEIMQSRTDYADVVSEVAQYLRGRAEYAVSRGIAKERIALDPGICFGKTVKQNLLLIKHIDKLSAERFPVLLGVSRKSFIGKLFDLPVEDRLEETLACQAYGYMAGVRLFRVHDVAQAVRVARMMEAIYETERI